MRIRWVSDPRLDEGSDDGAPNGGDFADDTDVIVCSCRAVRTLLEVTHGSSPYSNRSCLFSVGV